ncbi:MULTISPECIES: CAP domain-containing protein [unclassified Nocardioides]|uniref:CAP domain-containing protein n=1 Tax=unclassified Nocardioides TaxID=2615069 RepID=UPI0006FAFF2C|nr:MULTISPECIES: CAP domain-containing protein [unclassified Nocardioides]KRA39011.1 hypothetical protein ASD81_10640 [Nocardioides sp. Root614]KRA92970.1 hypothetical protein ASD84_10905 [Nocardioides sp. Root682]
MRALFTFIGTAAVLSGLLIGPTAHAAPAGAASAVPARASTAALMERDVITLINQARARKGCGALRIMTSLQASSGRHDALMARARRLSHQFPGEATLRTRVAAAGYTGAKMLGEVLAAGPTTASSAVRRWMSSTIHRALLLDCRFRAVGAGYAVSADGNRWWTIDLGRR